MKISILGQNIIGSSWLLARPNMDALVAQVLQGSNEIQLDNAGDSEEYSQKGAERATGEYIAIVPLKGILFKTTMTDEKGGPCGADKTVAQLECAYNDPKCKGVVIKMDCPGGMEDAAYTVHDAVYRRNKPVSAFVEFGDCQSGGMLIASQCDYIVASGEYSRVGSIGAYVPYIDYSKMFEMSGIKQVDIYAPQSRLKNYDIREASKGNYKPLTEYATKRASDFITRVYINRLGRWTESPKLADAFEGATLTGSEALEIGLIDATGTIQDAFNFINWANQNQIAI